MTTPPASPPSKSGKSPTPPPHNERPAEKPARVNEPSPVRPPDEPVPDKEPRKQSAGPDEVTGS